jgi:hypothetical protein
MVVDHHLGNQQHPALNREPIGRSVQAEPVAARDGDGEMASTIPLKPNFADA